MRVQGTITDDYSGQRLPGATIEFWKDGSLIAAVVADKYGSFIADVMPGPDQIKISNVGFQTMVFPVPDQPVDFRLPRLEIELEGVTVTAKRKKNSGLFWLLVLAGVLLISNKK